MKQMARIYFLKSMNYKQDMYYIQMMELEWSEIDLSRIAPVIESIIPGTTKYRSKPLFFVSSSWHII